MISAEPAAEITPLDGQGNPLPAKEPEDRYGCASETSKVSLPALAPSAGTQRPGPPEPAAPTGAPAGRDG
ncbi:hypothetical protein [Streptomyces sp. NBC_00096]|uniref:hypothetical protein n=1 Tax=Streptomyces sp. NBC_00096 TaxID=2975650 RepID=UPI003244E291